MNFSSLFVILAIIGSLVDADLVGWNRLSGSVSRSQKVISMVKSGGRPASTLDQYIQHFGATKSYKALKKLIRIKQMENKMYNKNKDVLFW